MNEPKPATFAFELSAPADVDASQLGKDIEEAWKAGVRSDETLQEAIRGKRLVAEKSPFKAQSGRSGVEPVSATILVTLAVGAANLTVKAANDIWDKIILPWLVRKYGQNAIRKSAAAGR